MQSTSQTHVIFGTGPLGLAAMRALVSRGQTVRMVNRSGRAPEHADIPAGVTFARADAYDPAQAADVVKGASAVYQCAEPPYHEWVTKFPTLQGNIMKAAAAAGAAFIVGDNLYMYGEPDVPIREDLPYSAHTRKGQLRARMAEAVMNAHTSGQIRAAIVRAATFYGPGVTLSTMGDRVFPALLAGEAAQIIGSADQPHALAYIEDFGAGLANVGLHERAWGQVWIVPHDQPPRTQGEVVRMAAQMAGVQPKYSVATPLMLRAAGLFMPAAREIAEMVGEFTKPYRIDDSKYRHAFPDHTPVPLEEGLRRTVAWYKGRWQVAGGRWQVVGGRWWVLGGGS